MKIAVVFCLVFVCSVGFTQEEKKRPSWSQGLPERQVAPQAGISRDQADTPDFEVSAEIEPISGGLEMELDTQAFAMPKPEIESVSAPAPAPEFTVPSAADRKEAREQYYAGEAEVVDQQQQELIKQYKWSVLKTSPIDIPSDYSGSSSLKLHIQINPKGRVVRVSRTDSTIPEHVVKSAEKSIKNWRFAPPQDLGIEENISKSFTIDVVTDA